MVLSICPVSKETLKYETAVSLEKVLYSVNNPQAVHRAHKEP